MNDESKIYCQRNGLNTWEMRMRQGNESGDTGERRQGNESGHKVMRVEVSRDDKSGLTDRAGR